jgi:hypothetical protein
MRLQWWRLFLCLFAGLPTVQADDTACLALCPMVVVEQAPADRLSRSAICDGAAAAIRFFSDHGVATTRQICISLRAADTVGFANHIGWYDATTRRIELLNLAQAQRQCRFASPFGMEMDPELYKSFVVHEVSHAITDQHFHRGSASRLTQEYLAYVAQLTTMAPKHRSAIMQRYPLQPFTSMNEMTLLYYALNPNAFAVKSFLHFERQDDQSGLIRDLLSGAVRPGNGEFE